MLTPNYGPSEFLDATTFNFMSQAVTTSLQQSAAAALTPGLVFPESATIAIAGLQTTVTFPAVFGIIFANGALAKAEGNIAGATSGTYIVNFASLVPSTGSQTAYLLCSVSQVGQSPVTVTGPPPGHPDWNPNFVPYTLYSLTDDSITLTASATPPDNRTTFSLGQVALTAGMTTLPPFNQNLNYRAGAASSKPVELRSGNWNLATDRQGVIQNIPGPSIFTLPPVAGLNGMQFACSSATTGSVTLQTSGSDVIWGTGTAGVASLVLVRGASITVVAQNGAWYIMSASPNMGGGGTGGGTGTTTNNFTFNSNNPPSQFIDMDINDTLYISFQNVQQVPTYVNTHGGVFRAVICLTNVSAANNDLFWLPNNQFYPGNSTLAADGCFASWASQNSDNGTTAPTFVGQFVQSWVATVDGNGNTLGWFAMDAFGDGVRDEVGDNINDTGPCMWDVLLGTSTLNKMLKYNGGVAGGCGSGVGRWYDTTTPWTILGTFGIERLLGAQNPSTISGFCYLTKIGGDISAP